MIHQATSNLQLLDEQIFSEHRKKSVNVSITDQTWESGSA
jgi:hypothetical protein